MTTTLAINTSLITDQNLLVQQLATQIGASAPLFDVCTALTNFLQQLSAADADAPTSEISDESMPQKKRKRSNSGDGAQKQVQQPLDVVEVPFRQSHISLHVPEHCRPLSSENRVDYSMLPQHIILEILEYWEWYMNVTEEILRTLLVRFKSQTLERQYHLMFRHIGFEDQNIFIRVCVERQNPVFEIFRRQVRSVHFFAWMPLVLPAGCQAQVDKQLFPNLRSITLNLLDSSILDVISEQTPQFIREKITAAEQDCTVITAENCTKIATLIPNLRRLDPRKIQEWNCFGLLPRLNTLEVDFENVADITSIFRSCPSLTALEASGWLLNDASEKDWHDLSEQLQKYQGTLRELSFLGNDAPESCSMLLGRSLRKLTLQFGEQFDFQGIELLCSLEHFSLHQTSTAVPDLKNAKCLALAPNLSCLCLDIAIIEIVHHDLVTSIGDLNVAGRLYSLEIDASNLVSGLYLSVHNIGIGRGNCALRSLKIHEYSLTQTNSFDFPFRDLIENCKYLQQISVQGYPVCFAVDLEERLMSKQEQGNQYSAVAFVLFLCLREQSEILCPPKRSPFQNLNRPHKVSSQLGFQCGEQAVTMSPPN